MAVVFQDGSRASMARARPPVLFHGACPVLASTSMVIGNGRTALLWEDWWIDGQSVRELLPNLYNCIPKRRRTARTVADGMNGNSWARDIHGNLGLHEIDQYLQLWQVLQHTVLSAAPDQLIWKWTASSTYSAQSCYLATFHGSTTCCTWKLE
uniref:Reverse transcriptase zinc-binding domain-containing protein n=2 Tax=Aegilops tauschii subsp. strangulata TaxID=200361 RepID=A0A453IF61_AEGTS